MQNEARFGNKKDVVFNPVHVQGDREDSAGYEGQVTVMVIDLPNAGTEPKRDDFKVSM